MIIGITGTDGAGKGTVVNYLVKEKGFVHYHARQLFLEEIRKRGFPEDRNQMRLVANELRAEHGDDFIVRFFLKQAKEEHAENVVIDSIRAFAEAQTLKEHGGILIAVDADQKLRYERVQARRSESDHVSFAEFKKHEELEMHDPDPHGMQKAKVIGMADYVVVNNGSLRVLNGEIENILCKLQKTAL